MSVKPPLEPDELKVGASEETPKGNIPLVPELDKYKSNFDNVLKDLLDQGLARKSYLDKEHSYTNEIAKEREQSEKSNRR